MNKLHHHLTGAGGSPRGRFIRPNRRIASVPQLSDRFVGSNQIEKWYEEPAYGPAGREPEFAGAKRAQILDSTVEPTQKCNRAEEPSGGVKERDKSNERFVEFYPFVGSEPTLGRFKHQEEEIEDGRADQENLGPSRPRPGRNKRVRLRNQGHVTVRAFVEAHLPPAGGNRDAKCVEDTPLRVKRG